MGSASSGQTKKMVGGGALGLIIVLALIRGASYWQEEHPHKEIAPQQSFTRVADVQSGLPTATVARLGVAATSTVVSLPTAILRANCVELRDYVDLVDPIAERMVGRTAGLPEGTPPALLPPVPARAGAAQDDLDAARAIFPPDALLDHYTALVNALKAEVGYWQASSQTRSAREGQLVQALTAWRVASGEVEGLCVGRVVGGPAAVPVVLEGGSPRFGGCMTCGSHRQDLTAPPRHHDTWLASPPRGGTHARPL